MKNLKRHLVRNVLFFSVMLCCSQGFAEQLLNLPSPLSGLRYNSFAELDKKWPVTHGEGAVCLWGDDKHSAVSFTIDDNSPGDIPFWKHPPVECCQRTGLFRLPVDQPAQRFPAFANQHRLAAEQLDRADECISVGFL